MAKHRKQTVLGTQITYSTSSQHEYISAFQNGERCKVVIDFAKGVGHSSWNTKQSYPAWAVARSLILGLDFSGTPRPVFDNYRSMYKDNIKRRARYYLTKPGNATLDERLEAAGKSIKEDLASKISSGRLGLASNKGKYATRKAKRGLGGTPFVATGELLSALEVHIEY